MNELQSEAELAAVRRSIRRGCPYGDETWTDQAVRTIGLKTTLRPRGRPRKTDREQNKGS